MKRERLTNRAASAPPANPGYGTEDQDHPAHQADPAHGDYAKGDPDAWAETPNPPPYAEGNPPADPGYDVEDQDHPAHTKNPRVPKEARGLQAAILSMAEAKADKCLKVAKAMLRGRKGITASMVEEQAFTMMDWSDAHLASTQERLGGGFLAEEFEDDLGPVDMDILGDDDLPPPDETEYLEDDELDALLADDDELDDDMGDPMAMLTAKVETLTSELTAMKAAAKKGEDDEEVVEGKKKAKKGEDEDAPEEKDPKEVDASMFASADEMGNPIQMTAEDSILNEIFGSKKSEDEDEEADEDDDKEAKKKKAKKSEDEDDVEEDEDKEAKKKKAKKSEDEDDVEEDVEEDEDKEAKKKKASKQRPQPRKPSKGVSRVGSVTRTSGGEINDLSKLWETSPDVSDVFNGK